MDYDDERVERIWSFFTYALLIAAGIIIGIGLSAIFLPIENPLV